MNRRDFLKLAGVGSLGLIGATLLPKHKPPKKRKKKMIHWVASSTSTYQASLSTFQWDDEALSDVDVYFGMIVGVAIFGSGSVASVRATLSFPVEWRDLTFIRADTNGIYRSEMWYLPNRLRGTYTIEVNLSASLTSIAGASNYAYFGGIGTHGGATGTGTPASKALTPNVNNSIVVSNLSTLTASGVTDASGQSNRYAASGALGTQRGSDKGPISPPASTTLQYDNIGVVDAWAMSSVELLNLITNPPAIMGSGM